MLKKNVEVPRETYLDDDIREAVDDAYCNAEGRSSAYYLRYELKRRGLFIMSYISLWIALLVVSGITTVSHIIITLLGPN